MKSWKFKLLVICETVECCAETMKVKLMVEREETSAINQSINQQWSERCVGLFIKTIMHE